MEIQKFIPNKNGGEISIINQEGTEIVGKFQYEKATQFWAGCCCVKIQGKWILIDENFPRSVGELDYDYDDIFDFSHGFAIVKVNGSLGHKTKYGYINSNYKECVRPIYDEAYNFEGGYGKVKKGGKWGWVDEFGNFYDKLPF